LFSYPFVVWPACVLCCAGGVYNVVYAFGFGYGLSMTLNGVMALSQFDLHRFKPGDGRAMARIGHMLGYVAYGVRLFVFLFQRQMAPSFIDKAQQTQMKSDAMSMGTKSMISLFVGTLMASYHFGVYYHAKSVKRPTALTHVGIAGWVLGLVIESVADYQKSVAKAQNPGSFVSTGLYGFCRHPNYFGEIVYHVSMFATGVTSCDTWIEVLLSAIAPVLMTGVMIGATKGLEKRQIAKYGGIGAYELYRRTTPCLWPFFGGV